jgi:hypothetical protein
MRTVMTFWQTPLDEAAFFEYLSRDQVIVFPHRGCATEAELAPISLSDYVRERAGAPGLLSLRSLQDGAMTYRLDRDGDRLFAINPTQNSVVGYAPGMHKDGMLTTTNVCAFWDMLREGALVKKSDEFCGWGKGIFKWLRKRVKVHKGTPFPMTTDADDAARNGVKVTEC